ncbi:trimeric intracellular cation channel family protein [Polluticaenibacter yanchengensis]|uniref:Trimeric intracellular cation channel family protein n=1 Tax=Polluticaenibacter yanchengensis TaxID=3014562 RepID=A0ABT4UJ06_9BACT|nr:trimeric intracellular cation channel family protein [Chitinophagaceae bacterium LY-5]
MPIDKIDILSLIDILGLVAFTISGVFAGMQKKLDFFGIFVIAFVTALGGGTLRDVLIGHLPVGWMRNGDYSIIIFITYVITLLFHKYIKNFTKFLIISDSIGLGFFTLSGIQRGLEYGLDPGFCIALGTMTGCFGGVVRDILLNKIPMVFEKEIYATACIIGGLIYFALIKLNSHSVPADITCILSIFVIRLYAVKKKLSLPNLYKQ